jgi:hypothetical protein
MRGTIPVLAQYVFRNAFKIQTSVQLAGIKSNLLQGAALLVALVSVWTDAYFN